MSITHTPWTPDYGPLVFNYTSKDGSTRSGLFAYNPGTECHDEFIADVAEIIPAMLSALRTIKDLAGNGGYSAVEIASVARAAIAKATTNP